MPTTNGLTTSRVTSVIRALSIFDAFAAGELSLTLAEIARRTRLHKTTVLRIARTMAGERYLVQRSDGSWRLGPASGRLGSRYNLTFDAMIIEPVLREVAQETGESASFYVREENARICIARIDGTRSVSYRVKIGQIIPLDKGAPGRLLLAFANVAGEVYERIRRDGYHVSAGERDPHIEIIAFPVFGANKLLMGCITIDGPRDRFDTVAIAKHIRVLRKSATRLSLELEASRSQNSKRLIKNRSSK